MTAASIRRLTLSNFRSYHAAELRVPGSGAVVLTGPNGAGKTNLHRSDLVSRARPRAAPRHARGSRLQRRRRLLGGGGRDRRHDGARDARHRRRAANRRRCPGKPAMPHRPRERVVGDRRSPIICASIWLMPAMDQLFNGPASERRRFFDRLVLAVDAQHSIARQRAGAVAALAQPAAGREHQRRAMARCGRARDGGARGRGRRRARRDRRPPRRRAGSSARTDLALPGRRDRARRHPRAHAGRAQRGPGRGPLSRAARENRATRRRRRAHARRAASHRPRGALCRQGHSRRRCLDRRAEGDADPADPRACRAWSRT